MKTELRVTRVSVKGQVVIPNEFREALKLEAGDAMIVQLEGSRVVLERRRTVIQALVGKYAPPPPRPIPASPLKLVEEGGQHGA